MERHINLPSPARGCTLSVTQHTTSTSTYSVALYQALASRSQPLVQLAYASADAIELCAPYDGGRQFHVLWLRADGLRRVCFEVTPDAAAAIAEFAGIALPPQLEAA